MTVAVAVMPVNLVDKYQILQQKQSNEIPTKANRESSKRGTKKNSGDVKHKPCDVSSTSGRRHSLRLLWERHATWKAFEVDF